jgi:hypothetical protein
MLSSTPWKLSDKLFQITGGWRTDVEVEYVQRNSSIETDGIEESTGGQKAIIQCKNSRQFVGPEDWSL